MVELCVQVAAGRVPVIAGAGHFLQEDAGESLASEVARFLRPSVTSG